MRNVTSRKTTRERLSAAFRSAYTSAGATQTALAEATGIDQQTISKYARGAVTVPLEVVERTEDALGYRRGHILDLAGFVEGTADTRATISADPHLDDEARALVLDVYAYARRRTSEARAAAEDQAVMADLLTRHPPEDRPAARQQMVEGLDLIDGDTQPAERS